MCPRPQRGAGRRRRAGTQLWRRLLALGVVLGACVLCVGCTQAPEPTSARSRPPAAIPAPPTPNPALGTAPGTAPGAGAGYLALGDSVAFGYRPPAVAPVADYLNASAFVGYPNVVARADHLRLVNASCPGETSASMIRATAQSNGCENDVGAPVGYRTAFPLHVRYSGSQLGYAVRYLRSHAGTALVTVDVGANDVFRCQRTTADRCVGSDLGATLRAVHRNLSTILAALRGRGGYRGPLVVLAYYSTAYATSVRARATVALNAALAEAARSYGARLADGYRAFERAAAATTGDGCAAGLLVPLPSGGCDVHPSARGQQVLATAVEHAIAPRSR